MLKYLMIILSGSSVSFCHYESRKTDKSRKDLMDYDDLKKTVVFALKNNLKVNVLYPRFKPDKRYDRLIDDVEHVKIVPYSLRKYYKDSILCAEPKDLKRKDALKGLSNANIILRLSVSELKELKALTGKLSSHCSRINLVLRDMENLKKTDVTVYRNQIEKISKNIFAKKGEIAFPEMNFLTDRIMLDSMNNCGAGVSHVTAAPDGKLYVCPAFYYEGADNAVGNIGSEPAIRNRRLLEIKYSPVCRICDAYQCRRCVYLNKKLTSEINIPSWQQCRTAHAEREASRLFLNKLKEIKYRGAAYREISEINYDDPFEIAVKNKFSIQDFKYFNSNEKRK